MSDIIPWFYFYLQCDNDLTVYKYIVTKRTELLNFITIFLSGLFFRGQVIDFTDSPNYWYHSYFTDLLDFWYYDDR